MGHRKNSKKSHRNRSKSGPEITTEKSIPKAKAKRTSKPPLFAKILLLMVVVFVATATILKVTDYILKEKKAATKANIPQLEISLADGLTVEEIDINSKDTRYPGNDIAIIASDTTTSYSNVEIKGHGNTTWVRPKKPYQIKFSEKTSLFDYNKSHKWILLANYFDHSYLRTDTTYQIEKFLNYDAIANGSFIELYIDGFYRGLYYLTEKVEIDKSRIDLRDNHGAIIELDNMYGLTDGGGCNYDQNKNCIIIKDLVNPDLETAATQEIVDSFNSLESAIAEADYKKTSELIDVDSFIKYYLLSEFIVNPDAYTTSFFLYKDGVSDKLHAGPGWDFDLALGNTIWIDYGINIDDFHSPFETDPIKNHLLAGETTDESYASKISTLVYDLMELPEFQTRVKQIYQSTLSGHGEELLDYIRSQATYIRDAAYRDAARWKLDTDFDEEVDYLIDWVAKRYDHFESTYGTTSEASQDSNENAAQEN